MQAPSGPLLVFELLFFARAQASNEGIPDLKFKAAEIEKQPHSCLRQGLRTPDWQTLHFSHFIECLFELAAVSTAGASIFRDNLAGQGWASLLSVTVLKLKLAIYDAKELKDTVPRGASIEFVFPKPVAQQMSLTDAVLWHRGVCRTLRRVRRAIPLSN